MSQPVTHYDILKVARDAPPEVVRAAYRALAQKYHPDRNPGDITSASTMSMLNVAYRVLSDLDLRAQYDHLLSSSEIAESLQNATEESGPLRSTHQQKHPAPPAEPTEYPKTDPAPGSRTVDLDEIWARFVGQGNDRAPPYSEPPDPIDNERPAKENVDLENMWKSFLSCLNPWGTKK